jgi:flagellar biosynthesis chaperone FliJ
MISLGGLVSQKAFGKFEMGKVISNPFANAFIKEGDGEDHEVSMANNSLDTIIKMATELKAKMGEDEKDIPAWIQDHITNAENFISQASSNYHEYGQNEARIAEDKGPCWKGYKQVGMKDKGGRQVPNCVPNESVVKENILNEDLDALGLLIPALGALIGGGLAQLYPYFTGRPNIYNNIKDWWNSKKDNSEMNKIANRIKNDPDVQEFLKKKNKSGWKEMLKKKLTGSELNYLNKIYRSRFNNESVNEASNTGEKIQNLNNRIKVLRDKISATKSPEQKKLHSDRLKNALQSLSNTKKDFGIKKEISNKTPKIFVKTAAVEKKIRELMADRKKAVVPYNTEKDPDKKEKLKQILIKLTQQIQGYEKNLIQLRDMEEEYLQQMHADAELDTSGL